jgi:sugar phosphate isomerase/epimerase
MKLGLLTAPFESTPLLEVADWAAAHGYPVLEIACWPRSSGEARRYAGTSHIDVANLSQGEADDLVGELTSRGIEVSGLGYYPNPMHPDLEHRAMTHEHLKAVMRAAALMGGPVVNTFIGNDKNRTPSQTSRSSARCGPS